MKRNISISLVLLALGAAAAGGLAYGKLNLDDRNDVVVDLAKAKIGIVQAIAAAEAHAQGKATKAELESEHGNVAFQVEVVAAGPHVVDVLIDAINGKVLSSQPDLLDVGDREGQKD